MDNNTIYKAVFETIESTLDWGQYEKDIYPYWITGVIDLANNLLEEIKIRDGDMKNIEIGGD